MKRMFYNTISFTTYLCSNVSNKDTNEFLGRNFDTKDGLIPNDNDNVEECIGATMYYCRCILESCCINCNFDVDDLLKCDSCTCGRFCK